MPRSPLHKSAMSLLRAVAVYLCVAALPFSFAARGSSSSSSSSLRIVGGVPTNNNPAFQFFAYSTDSSCGASLIHSDILLTAGHCLRIGFAKKKVVVGIYERDEVKSSVAYELEKQIQHPEFSYNGIDISNDIALFKLKTPVVNVTPISIAEEGGVPSVGDQLTVVGLGRTKFSYGRYPDQLLRIDIPMRSNDVCRDIYSKELFKPPEMFCAGGGGKQSCSGDSGGPVVDMKRNQLVGIVSFGRKCGMVAKDPDVYTRVSAYRDFIQSTICSCSANPPEYCALQNLTKTCTGTAPGGASGRPGHSLFGPLTGMK